MLLAISILFIEKAALWAAVEVFRAIFDIGKVAILAKKERFFGCKKCTTLQAVVRINPNAQNGCQGHN
jgi:hypothetical protein